MTPLVHTYTVVDGDGVLLFQLAAGKRQTDVFHQRLHLGFDRRVSNQLAWTCMQLDGQ